MIFIFLWIFFGIKTALLFYLFCFLSLVSMVVVAFVISAVILIFNKLTN